MHMALNPDGVFDPRRLRGPGAARRTSASRRRTRDVLELACGNGYNLGCWPARNPERRLVGIDLVGAQVRRANSGARGPAAGRRAVVGDFQSLPFGDASQDAVFVVESLCHATDLALAFARGRARAAPRRALHRRRRLADRRVRRPAAPSCARRRSRSSARWPSSAGQSLRAVEARGRGACGLHVVEELDLTAQIAPNLDAARGDRRALPVAPAAGPCRAASSRRGALLMNAVAAVPHAARRARRSAHVPPDRARARPGWRSADAEAAHGAVAGASSMQLTRSQPGRVDSTAKRISSGRPSELCDSRRTRLRLLLFRPTGTEPTRSSAARARSASRIVARSSVFDFAVTQTRRSAPHRGRVGLLVGPDLHADRAGRAGLGQQLASARPCRSTVMTARRRPSAASLQRHALDVERAVDVALRVGDRDASSRSPRTRPPRSAPSAAAQRRGEPAATGAPGLDARRTGQA